MSQENVEIVGQLYGAFNLGDIGRVLSFVHPDFEATVPPELSAEPDTYRGHDGVRRYFESFQDALDEVRFQPERFWDVDHTVVVAVVLTARGRHTAIPVEQRITQVWSVRDGRALWVQTYASLPEALRAVGLSE